MIEKKYIHRHLETIIKEAVQYFPVISVTGPRQFGKTTLLKYPPNLLKFFVNACVCEK
jgi:predicted AAA+ superfamily ATPase